MFTQERQKLEQRQTEYGEEIALDFAEQLRAAAFKMISADGQRHSRPDVREVLLKEGVAEVAHRKARDCGVMPDGRAVQRDP